jgi:hypothetical protein
MTAHLPGTPRNFVSVAALCRPPMKKQGHGVCSTGGNNFERYSKQVAFIYGSCTERAPLTPEEIGNYKEPESISGLICLFFETGILVEAGRGDAGERAGRLNDVWGSDYSIPITPSVTVINTPSSSNHAAIQEWRAI